MILAIVILVLLLISDEVIMKLDSTCETKLCNDDILWSYFSPTCTSDDVMLIIYSPMIVLPVTSNSVMMTFYSTTLVLPVTHN